MFQTPGYFPFFFSTPILFIEWFFFLFSVVVSLLFPLSIFFCLQCRWISSHVALRKMKKKDSFTTDEYYLRAITFFFSASARSIMYVKLQDHSVSTFLLQLFLYPLENPYTKSVFEHPHNADHKNQNTSWMQIDRAKTIDTIHFLHSFLILSFILSCVWQ